ncbi:hypothetical protein RBA41_01985 [Massilia sp. CCM 9210]|uniref:hypothetical protein n=1 Tax=Massilia scottii TaxID=3057166 RepID=UPI0027969C9E|nr:hypothetical protein [Massilia sp. CCM 9210]MDQ1812063.1 hypothetical protein [Massilia sp. CCM 9210]
MVDLIGDICGGKRGAAPLDDELLCTRLLTGDRLAVNLVRCWGECVGAKVDDELDEEVLVSVSFLSASSATCLRLFGLVGEFVRFGACGPGEDAAILDSGESVRSIAEVDRICGELNDDDAGVDNTWLDIVVECVCETNWSLGKNLDVEPVEVTALLEKDWGL